MVAFIWILAIVGSLFAVATAAGGYMQAVPSTEVGEVVVGVALPLLAILLARRRMRAIPADGSGGAGRTTLMVPVVISGTAVVVLVAAWLLQPR